jgi:FkbM family methyltransferase
VIRGLLSRGYAAINRVLRPLGLRLHKTHAPTRTFEDFFAHLRSLGMEFRTVIDVGVARGTPSIYRAFPRAKYLLVEPLEEFRPTLERLTSRLDATYVLAAAGATDGEVELHVHSHLSGSSLLRQAEGTTLDGVTRRVRSVRLDGALPTVVERPCLLKIDTQGSELEVLDGLGRRIAEMDVLIIEASLLPFRVGAPVLAELIARLDTLGFAVYDILEGHVRALDGALAQVDLVFVPKTGELRRDPRFFSPDQLARYARQATGHGER